MFQKYLGGCGGLAPRHRPHHLPEHLPTARTKTGPTTGPTTGAGGSTSTTDGYVAPICRTKLNEL